MANEIIAKLTVRLRLGGSHFILHGQSEKPFILTCLESRNLSFARRLHDSDRSAIAYLVVPAACGIRSVRPLSGARPIWCGFVSSNEEKRYANSFAPRQPADIWNSQAVGWENFNLHTGCLDRSAKEQKHESNTAQWTSPGKLLIWHIGRVEEKRHLGV
jgi:hypothetical protein